MTGVQTCALPICAAIAFQAGSDARDNIITYNSVRNTGLIIGSAKGTYNGFYSGIAGGSENGKIEYNTVTNSGYNGIIAMFGHNTTIQYNVIDSSCIVLDDGAAIYTAGPTSRNTLINGNIVSNTIGNSVGSLAPPTLVGIYLDEFANDEIGRASCRGRV